MSEQQRQSRHLVPRSIAARSSRVSIGLANLFFQLVSFCLAPLLSQTLHSYATLRSILERSRCADYVPRPLFASFLDFHRVARGPSLSSIPRVFLAASHSSSTFIKRPRMKTVVERENAITNLKI